MYQYVVEQICRSCGDLVCKLEPRNRPYGSKKLAIYLAIVTLDPLTVTLNLTLLTTGLTLLTHTLSLTVTVGIVDLGNSGRSE